jgi:hypothetical protein
LDIDLAAMPLTVLSHPIAESLLTELRDKHTPPSRYRRLCHRLTTMLVIEATRHLPVKAKEIETPMEPFAGVELAASPARRRARPRFRRRTRTSRRRRCRSAHPPGPRRTCPDRG